MFYGENTLEVLDALKFVYFMYYGKNIPVFELGENEKIEKYLKTFKDVAKGLDLLPDKKWL